MKFYTESELRETVQLNQNVIQIIEDGFSSLITKKVEMPPIMRVDIPENNGEVDLKTAYIPGYNQFAIKMSSGFFNNPRLGLPSGSGMMILLSTETGFPQAILLDNGYLTDVRTAAAGAISAKYFAKEQMSEAGVIGTGNQARFQMEALKQVRDFKVLYVYGRNEEKANRFKQDMEEKLDAEVIICPTVEEVVRQSDTVVTTTPAETPLIQADWLHPGLHITAMGSDAEHKQEIDSTIFSNVDRIICDVKHQCLRLGELHHAKEDGAIADQTEVTEIGQVVTGHLTGRASDDEITICDLTGTGIQDTAIALFAYQELENHPVGIEIANE
ncbi:ornithine cyclodeaminase [Salinibacillus kushneri]|uniref:Ornithine cyclodeaminase n=1 Tax=Salinibacillus kushneri TaxID=237682 RepID=A0A1I0CMA7_9BACI|nr:cyclodeaminase [Salinibacillus kushneri]SET20115.1 ornithine cyclodeaminase [Salinibacillus kushneri]